MLRRALALIPALVLAASGTVATAAQTAEVEPPGTVEVAPAAELPAFTSTTIALSPGRIVWLGVSSTIPVYKRALSVGGSVVHLGTRASLGNAGVAVAGEPLVFSSGARTLWASRAGSSSPFQVNLTSGSSTKVISHNGIPLRLSGNRALFQRRTDNHYVIYDLRTGTYLDVTARYGTRLSSGTPTVDLFGNNLVYVTKGLTVRLKNLSTSAPSVVLARGGGYNGADVLAYGDWVAWNQYVHFSDGFDNEDYCRLRNVRTMAPAVTISCARSLTSAGVVSYSASDHTWTLRPYAGTVTTLPVPSSTYALDIDDKAMAWADADGLHAAPLPDPVTNQPRSLGNPVTKAKDYIGGTPWSLRLVTTAPLDTCSVQITKSGVLIRQLACNAGVLAAGEVQVHWDSRNSHGNLVGPGTFRWTAYAVNDHRSMLRSDGASKQTTGILTVVAR